MPSEIICGFSSIKVSIPKRRIRKHFWERRQLSFKEMRYFKQKSAEIEDAVQKLLHVKSLVDKIQNRGYNLDE